MSAVTQTTSRPQNNGRVSLEIKIEGGRVHLYEVDPDLYYRAISDILRAESTVRIATEPPNETPKSSAGPGIPGGS